MTLNLSQIDISSITTIATDLDGTALNPDHHMAPETVQALDALVDRGYHVMMATGRPYRDVEGINKIFKNELAFVTANGAMLNNCDPVPPQWNFIPEQIVREITAMEHQQDIVLNVYTRNHWFVDNPNEVCLSFFVDSHFNYEIIDFNKLPFNHIIKMFFIDPNCDTQPTSSSTLLNSLQQTLIERYGDQIECVFSQVNCLEVNAGSVSKYATIKSYLAYFNQTPEQNLLALGDGMNDELMIKGAKYGFIMGNADPRLKQALASQPSVTVVGPNYELMVARVLNDIFKLELDLPPYFTATTEEK